MTRDLECREVMEMLSEYLDTEVPPEGCESIRAHLAGCAACVEVLKTLRKTVKLCGCFETDVAPEEFSESERARLRQAWLEALGSMGRKQPG